MLGALRRTTLPASAVILIAGVAALSADVAVGGRSKAPVILVLAIVLLLVAGYVASRWSWLVAGLAIVDLLIPSDGRYTAAGGLPFQLEPYRVFVALLLAGWIASLLCDPRVKVRRTGFEGPLGLILFAIAGSLMLNPGRVSGITSFVIKSVSLEASFLLVIYLVVSVVRTRATLERLITILVCAGTLEAVAAIVERKLHFNIFNHEHVLLPIFQFNNVLETALSTRNGLLRAQASAGHPIELSATLAMLVPLAVYLGIARRQRRWYAAAMLLLAGDFAGGSRTGLIAIVAMLMVFLALRPRQTLRCWPALIPALLVVHFLDPGAIGGFYEGLFPQGGLIAEQSQTFRGPGGVLENANRLSRWGPELHAFASYNPLFGEGFGTRITGRTSLNAKLPFNTLDYSFGGQSTAVWASGDNAEILDDQWLGTLLETGVLGVIGWLWLFARGIRRLAARAKRERSAPGGWLPVALAAALTGFATSMWFYDAFSFTQGAFLLHLLIALTTVFLLLPASAPQPAMLRARC